MSSRFTALVLSAFISSLESHAVVRVSAAAAFPTAVEDSSDTSVTVPAVVGGPAVVASLLLLATLLLLMYLQFSWR